jgi:peroxiredoxin
MAITKTKLVLRSIIVLLLVFIGFSLYANRVPKPTIAEATGKAVPDFTLRDQDGKDFAIASQRGHKVLLMFYRGYWWPFCVSQLREFAQHSQEFDALNTRIVAISADDVQHARQVWEQKVDRKFPVLSDPQAKVISQFGILHSKGHGDEDIAIRTSVLVDENGNELWRRVSTSATDTPKPDELLQRIRTKWPEHPWSVFASP